MHRIMRQTAAFGQRAGAPLGRVRGLTLQGQRDDAFDLRIGDGARRACTRKFNGCTRKFDD